ncbi:MAG: hypothetical protein ABIT10_04595 [Alteraurantiacibacter sp.]
MIWKLTSAAAIALMASSALAQPGNGGGGNGNGGGNGGNRAERPAAAAAEPARGNGNPGQRDQRSAAQAIGRAEAQTGNRAIPGGLEPRGNGNRGREQQADNRSGASGAGRNAVERLVGEQRRAPNRYVFDGPRNGRQVINYPGSINGCPPGLAAKHNGCQPPGQARKTGYLVRDDYDLGWWGLPRYDGGRYRYDDGYLLRLGRDGNIASFIPLLGGALSVGNPWPSAYGYDQLTPYYSRYYGLGPVGSYRFADNVVYRVDPETSAINSIAALLTGDDFTVGQRMPAGYDVYNVPYTYRDQYADSPDASYRYSDGYIYQVDPQTQLVASVIELLTS